MRELLRTNNVVRLSYLEALLRAEDIEPIVLDQNISVMEGSISVFPRRLAVSEDDYDRARWLLEKAGEHHDS